MIFHLNPKNFIIYEFGAYEGFEDYHFAVALDKIIP